MITSSTTEALRIARGCPVCGGEIGDDRLRRGLPCTRCMEVPPVSEVYSPEELCQHLSSRGNLEKLCKAEAQLQQLVKWFERATGVPMWNIQRMWAKRLLLGHSFVLVSPPGMGKTTFGLVAGLFRAPRVLILLPTRILVQQTGKRLQQMAERLGKSHLRILVYESRKVIQEQFRRGEWDILIATSMFFHRNLENLLTFQPELRLIFLDDTDSFLKAPGSAERLLRLAGVFPPENRLSQPVQVVLSSATVPPSPRQQQLFRQYLGVDIHRAETTLRNVTDLALPTSSETEALQQLPALIHQLGEGGILLLGGTYTSGDSDRIVQHLEKHGIRVRNSRNLLPERLLELLEKEPFDVVVGVAGSTSPLVRGLDLPLRLRYVIFLDVPVHRFPLRAEPRIPSLLRLLHAFFPVFSGKEQEQARRFLSRLRKYRTLPPERFHQYPSIKRLVEEATAWLNHLLESEDFRHRIQESPQILVDFSMQAPEKPERWLIIPDTTTYIQASGRTSRLTPLGLTPGISVVIYWREAWFRALERRLQMTYFSLDVRFRTFDEVSLPDLVAETRAFREKLQKFRKSPDLEKDIPIRIRTTLVIVESPSKARTIASFSGKPQIRRIGKTIAYEIPAGDRILVITASLGHVLDLTTRPGLFGVHVQHNRYVGIYDTIKRWRSRGIQFVDQIDPSHIPPEDLDDRLETLQALQQIATEVDEVFIATDPDAEGEKIAYDLYVLLRPFNSHIYRMEFHEISPRAFWNALQHPRTFQVGRVHAQITRRIADRWVGFTFSRLLWKAFGKETLSAGRVQTPVLGWVIERTRQARQKRYRLGVKLKGYPSVLHLDLPPEISLTGSERKQLHTTLEVAFLEASPRPAEKTPPPPYTTDTILQDTSKILRYSTGETMALLQELFEKGFITYHRTDSTRVSDEGIFRVAQPYIAETWGEEYFQPRRWGEGGAHECIRPVRPIDPEQLQTMSREGWTDLSIRAIPLYRLIFQRFIASQMKPARVRVKKLRLQWRNFCTEEEVVMHVDFPGFLRIFPLAFPLYEGDPSTPQIERVDVRKVPIATLFTEGTLVREMRQRGLGRPSTYAKIVETLQKRGYVLRTPSGHLVATRHGQAVYDYLRQFHTYLSEDFTREMEHRMDRIENGEEDWQAVLRELVQVLKLLPEEERKRIVESAQIMDME